MVSVQDSVWMRNDYFGAACIFEGDAVGFPSIGYTLGVLQPGRPSGLYPRSESALRHGAGAESETSSSAEAYAPFPKGQPGGPEDENGLPWASPGRSYSPGSNPPE